MARLQVTIFQNGGVEVEAGYRKLFYIDDSLVAAYIEEGKIVVREGLDAIDSAAVRSWIRKTRNYSLVPDHYLTTEGLLDLSDVVTLR